MADGIEQARRGPGPGDAAQHRRQDDSSLYAAVCSSSRLPLFFIYPFLIQISTSFKTDPDAAATRCRSSRTPSPRRRGSASSAQPGLVRADPAWLQNSVVITLVVTAGRVFFDSLAGYALSRLQFRGRKAVFAALLAVMAVPGVALLIPKFLMVNYLGIYDTYTAMILPLIVDAAGVFIMKQFFDSVPVSIEEAARMDGASIFRTFWSVVLPMARPALITLTILSFQGSWNEFSHFLVVTQGPGAPDARHRSGEPDQRPAGRGHAVPAQARHRAAHDDPRRAPLLRSAALLHPRRQRGRRQGLSAARRPAAQRPSAAGRSGVAGHTSDRSDRT